MSYCTDLLPSSSTRLARSIASFSINIALSRVRSAASETCGSCPLRPSTTSHPHRKTRNAHSISFCSPPKTAIRHFVPRHVAVKLLLERLARGREAVKRKLELEYSPVHVTFTTGRTSLATQFLYASMDFERLHIVGKRLIELCGIKHGDRGLNVFPFAPHLAFWQTFAVGQAMTMLIVHTGGGKVMGTAGNIAALERLQPAMLIGVPGYVYHMLRRAHEQRVQLNTLRFIALGAERVPTALKARLIALCDAMGAKNVVVHGVYGFTEARHAWAECTPPNSETSYGYHTYPDFDVFEIINPDTGEPVGPGERGEVVYYEPQWTRFVRLAISDRRHRGWGDRLRPLPWLRENCTAHLEHYFAALGCRRIPTHKNTRHACRSQRVLTDHGADKRGD